MLFEKSREFIYRNARPIDLARWNFHFEDGTKEEVLHALSFYQNADGGFGHALEADVWNPNSLPMGTWKATEVLADIGFCDASHPLVAGILKYLDSGAGYESGIGQWANTMPTNNDYPHAIWWEHGGEGKEFNPNPSAALAGFLIAYADRGSGLYEKGRAMAVRCYEHMSEHMPIKDQHIICCYIRLYEYCMRSIQGGEKALFDMDQFRECLSQMVDASLCADVEQWGKSYVPMPSTFIDSPESFLYEGREELVQKECEIIKEQQLADGSFFVPWSWCTEYEEEKIAKNWWKSELTINKLLFLKNFGQ